MSGKRLNKVAKEFNISISTIVDFLATKGFKIDSNPNTKIEGEVLSALDQEFAADKTAKQASENVAVSREKRESLSLKDVKKEKVSDESDEDDEEEVKPRTAKTSVAEKKKDIEAEVEKKVEKVIENEKVKVAVVGKIDLDAINQRTRPDKKGPVDRSRPKKVEEEVIKPAPKVEVKPVKEAPKVHVPEPIETIKAKTEKLTGPTVVGRIVLPVVKEKSTAETAEQADRRKRKRIKKVNVEKNRTGNSCKKTTFSKRPCS